MKRVTVVFSSGAQIQFDAVDFTVNKSGLGEFRGFSWTTNPALGPQIARINPDNVDAVLIEEIPEENEATAAGAEKSA